MGKAMYAAGLRYVKNDKKTLGKPDFCFKGKKIAVFCDSEFWHGKKFLLGERFKKNAEYWNAKIKANIERDEKVTRELIEKGWKVIRFWGKDIERNLDECVNKVKAAYVDVKSNGRIKAVDE